MNRAYRLALDFDTDASPHWLVASVVTALAYAVAGLAVLPLALPPGVAVPLFPAAGIALASVLCYGPRMLGAVALGAFAVNLRLALQHGGPDPLPLPLWPALAGAGAVLQAWAGAMLVRRFVGRPLTLVHPRDIMAFLVAGAVSCLASASVAHAGLWFTGAIDPAQLPLSFATWWVGDLIGVLIVAPIVLTLIGRPRGAWAPRRLSVGLTLTLVTLLLGLAIRQVVIWNEERAQASFDHDAASAAIAFSAQLREPLQALQALHGVFMASDDVTSRELALATHAWLAPGSLQAMGYYERVHRDDVPAYEARMRAAGKPTYAVFDRGRSEPIPGLGDDLIVMRDIEPREGNAAALGVNALSIPPAREAIARTLRSGQPVATAGFRLTQQPGGGHGTGVVLYQAFGATDLPEAAPPIGSVRGVVFVTLRMDAQLQALAPLIPTHLRLCLVDVGTDGVRQRLAGALGCEVGHSPLQHVHALRYAGRDWEVRVSATPAALPRRHDADVWLFALVGLMSTVTLGGFLLTVTGRTRRIESAVLERTAALQAEVRERQVADAALRESEQRFRNILDSIPIGVIYTDLRGNVKTTNPRFCELTGYSEAELATLSLSDYTHPEDLVQDIELMAQLVRGDIPMYRRHKRYIAKSGATVWVQATVSLLRDANGKPRSIVGVVEDITEHLKLEEAEHAREAAEASNRAKSDFLSRMSHELRTPLNAMLGFAQLLELDQRQPLTPTQQPWVAQIQQAGWHLLEMINDVLDLSRIESGNLRLQLGTLDLNDALEASIAMVSGDAQQRGIAVSEAFAPGTGSVIGDATRVKQILTNVLSNAVKYNADGGRIHVDVRPGSATSVEITVSDTGLGMTPAQLADLFQPFNRLGRERSSQQGTGIGLVISQRLAELMGGSLRARSTAGHGSSFILTLPCSAEPDTVRSDLGPLETTTAEYHRRSVHYVEDNETNVEVMRGILAQRPQVDMHVSITGLDGLAAIRARKPDLILLDMHLPDISGMELLRHLKADPRTAGIPVVVVSADALAQQIDDAFEAGCSQYLTKPVSVAELLAVVDRLLEQADTHFDSI